jgi:hypothetical protein
LSSSGTKDRLDSDLKKSVNPLEDPVKRFNIKQQIASPLIYQQ